VITGKVLDIAVDIAQSLTFGKWEFYELDGKSNKMVYIPEDLLMVFSLEAASSL
jgi:dTDP-4-dehydrorhamnose 3,5-epimerase-like enzyme